MEQIFVLSKDKYSKLNYYMDPEVLRNDYDRLEKFILAVERNARSDMRYDIYLSKLHELGALKCAILGNLPDGVDIHMHHGPMFTLYTVVEIIVRYHMHKGDLMTTMSIADEVLQCHEDDMVQVVGLSKVPHKAWHMSKIFVHMKASIAGGSIDKFIDKYKDGLGQSHIKQALRFVDMCKEYEGNIDNDLFEASKRLSFKIK